MQTNDTTNQPHFRWIDLVRALSAFLVVLAHVEYSGSGSSVVRTFYYALTRVAVPLFFMVSGFLLLSRNEPYLEFFRKRFLKVFIPFIIWSIIYLIWKGELLDQPLITILKSYFVKIIRGPRENHLWFFYQLFGLYLFTPILRVYVEKASIKDLLYFCGIWFVLTPLANLIQEFTPIQIGFEYGFLNGYIGYFVFGYLTSRLNFSRSHKLIALAVFFTHLVLTTAAMYLSRYYEIRSQYFEDYLSFNVVLMSCSLFIALTGLDVSDLIDRITVPLSRASFGIYLVHVIVMFQFFWFPAFLAWSSQGSAIYMIPLLGFVGFGLSFLLVFVLQRTPVLKMVVP